MHMVKDFKDIREFICLAEVCNYQEAADLLYISASSLSKHIMALEDVLGVPLFDRSTRRVSLTKYGETFYKYAQQMIKVYDECNNALNELRVDSEHHLSVGFLSRLEQCGIVEILSDFLNATPGSSIDTIATNSPLETLKEQKCQFIFDVTPASEDSEFESILFKTDCLVAVLPRNHALAGMKKIRLEPLAGERVITHNYGATDPADINCRQICEDAGFVPNIVMSTSYTSTIVKLVRQGNGISLLNRMNIPAAILPTVSTVEIEPKVPYSIYLIYSKKQRLYSVGRKFLEFINSLCQS